MVRFTNDRWTTRDPLGEAGGMNLYAFVGNNPVNWVNLWGLVQTNPNDPALPPLVKHPWPQAKQYYGVNQQCVALTRHFTYIQVYHARTAGEPGNKSWEIPLYPEPQ